ncbi:S8/S53 family peptidase [Kaistella sp. G5-32]|uniref:S8/S53 family peptidase n=1 Tax=Kaistella gelatinilytica TaxID=2787636 RepID=A0ABS0F978_9FLAO|nr:S8/S53 family peptidase [Kaistella gelatinilytica]MBF8456262.1 S8/S53 family peptidase [Kaistella gelatinilytica]
MEILNKNGKVIPQLITKGDDKKPWDSAHDYLDEEIKSTGNAEYVEPNLENKIFSAEDPESFQNKAVSALEIFNEDEYLKNWPKPEMQTDRFVWHLNDQFSEFKKANKKLLEKIPDPKIKIGHIDTGFQPDHPALPKNLNKEKSKSFIKGEEGKQAIDIASGKSLEQDGHGTATMILLAGNSVKNGDTNNNYEGFVGAAPFAEIISMRISETVALIQTSAFVDALEYAISEGCEVISMSMAGAPSKAWANMVNKAYEAGITIVTAAGNSWFEGPKQALPKRVLYPARWDRVIAATGVACDNLPYVLEARLRTKSEGGETMQGNFGPEDVMTHALAAYTPNVIWATMNDKGKYFRLDGGGTSSATPQVAAAAAIWLTNYRDEINEILKKYPGEKWRKVEMVKNALFNSAERYSYPLYKIYLGRGILKADKALLIPPSGENLTKAKEANVNLWGILDLLGLLLRLKGDNEADDVRSEMFQAEILQQMHNNPNLQKFLDYEETDIWTDADRELMRQELLKSDTVSDKLKEYLRSE